MVTPQNKRRLARVNESIRDEISRQLLKSVDDPGLAWVTITAVEVSPDLKSARAFFVVSAGEVDPEAASRRLNRAASFIQSAVGKNLKLRYTPRLTFKYDTSFDTADRVDRLIGEVVNERDNRPAPTPEETLGRLVSESEAILVMTHRNPDGDAVGSLLGFSRMLRLLGKKPLPFCPDGIPGTFSYLSGIEEVKTELPPDMSFELTVCLDTADEGLLPKGLPERSRLGTLVVVDHHATHGPFGDVVIRREASAVGEMLLELQQQLIWPMDQAVAECLYTSIVADTGSFRYSNTTADTHRAASELIAAGARAWVVATALFESYPLARQRLLSAVLDTLEVSEEGRYAELYCTPEMLADVGASKGDLDNIINFGRAVDTVEVAALFRVEPSGDIKVSFRSKGRFDVAALASRFGGGGHRNAAGCTLKETALEDAKGTVKAAVGELFGA